MTAKLSKRLTVLEGDKGQPYAHITDEQWARLDVILVPYADDILKMPCAYMNEMHAMLGRASDLPDEGILEDLFTPEEAAIQRQYFAAEPISRSSP